MKPVSFIRTSPHELGEDTDMHEYEHPLSLDAHFVRHPTSTFFVRVGGEMNVSAELDIRTNDVLVVDRAVLPTADSLSIFVRGGVFTVERFGSDDEEAEYWGRVVALARKV